MSNNDDIPKMLELDKFWDLPELLQLKKLRKENKELKEKVDFGKSVGSRFLSRLHMEEKKTKRLTEENDTLKKQIETLKKQIETSDKKKGVKLIDHILETIH